nr:relaxase/mobilization nuclease domain-containing protein [uncultured Carboxylicivirga sp.]
MVIVMHQSTSTEAALLYNESKVEKGKAKFFHHKNTNATNPFSVPKDFRMDTIRNIEATNSRVKQKCFHVSFNPGPEDMKKMSVNDLKKEMDRFMKQMGYGDQPYFVYHHKDIDREHFHLVSTRIDLHSFKKIKDNNEKRRINTFVTNLEQTYHLDHSSKLTQTNQLIPDNISQELYNTIQSTFLLLNESALDSKQQYLDILKGYNLEIKESERGYSVFVTDQNGNPLRHPISLSDFKDYPDYEHSIINEPESKIINQRQSEIERVLKALNKDYRFYSEEELKAALFRNDLLLYRNSKNKNLTVFSIKDKAPIDAQFLIKKYRSRLKDFVLSSDDFYGLIREAGALIFNKKEAQFLNHSLSINSNSFKNIGAMKSAVNGFDFGKLDSFKKLNAEMDSNQTATIEKAVKSHLNFLLDRAEEKSVKQSLVENLYSKPDCFERLKHQYIWEVVNQIGRSDEPGKPKLYGRMKRRKKGKGIQ